MNRALRRKQAKQPKSRGEGSGGARPVSAPTTQRQSSTRRERSSGGGILSWRPRFIMDVVNELRKVVWPTRDDVVYLTIVVVIIAIIFGAVLGGIDIAFGWLIDHTLLG